MSKFSVRKCFDLSIGWHIYVGEVCTYKKTTDFSPQKENRVNQTSQKRQLSFFQTIAFFMKRQLSSLRIKGLNLSKMKKSVRILPLSGIHTN